MAKIISRKKGNDKVDISKVEGSEKLPIPQFNAEEVSRLIRLRRSIFPPQFSGEAVRREEVELLLENANWAPNHGKTEPWRFKVMTGDALKRFGEEHANLYKQVKSEDEFQQKKFDKLQKRPTECSHLIAICAKLGANPKIPEIEEVEAVACAVQNMHLTATALGLAAYWGSGGMTYHDGMKHILKLDEDEKCLGFFFIGRPKENQWPVAKRKSNGLEKVKWITA